MKKPWLLAVVGLLTIVFALGAVACSDDNKDNNGGTTPAATSPSDTTPSATTADQTPTETSSGTPALEIAPITINEVGGSGVTGTATITETADGTEVVVNITAGLDAGDHQSHIHHGACSDPTGPIHVNLNSISAAADGSGTATTTNPTDSAGVTPPFSHWLAVPHYVAVHALDGTVIGCGDVG